MEKQQTHIPVIYNELEDHGGEQRHNGRHFPFTMMPVVEPALKRSAACVWLGVKDTLTLAWLYLASDFSLE